MSAIKLAIGSDHAGFDLKEQVKTWLTEMGFTMKDYGTYSEESVDYPDYIHPVAEAIVKKEYDYGIIICGTGNGAAITANKHKHIRAALCWLPELASLAKQHNNANIISLPARFINFETAKHIIEQFLIAEFEGGRHQKRIEKIEL
jgi:ribose 5-phosphate isomerase B